MLLVGLVAAASFWAFRQIEEAAHARRLTYDLLSRADDVLAAVLNAETGQRGFSLTGDESSLEPYLEARANLDRQVEELHRLALNPQTRQHVDTVMPMIRTKMERLAEVIELRRKQDMTAVIAIVRGDQGKRLMDSIRIELKAFVQLEEKTLAERENQLQSDLRRLFAVIVAASGLAVLLALSFAYLLYRETQHELRNLAHVETERLLGLQQEMSRQLRLANATLQASEKTLTVLLKENGDLKSALDEHAVVAITDPAGRITHVSDKFCTISGYAREALLGQDHRLIKSGHHPAEFMRELWTTITRGCVWHGEMKNQAKDGSGYWVDTTIVPFLDEHGRPRQYLAIGADITERKSNEIAAARLAAIVTSSDDAIIGKDLQGVVTSWNAGAENTFGYTSREMVGQSIRRLIPAGRQAEEGNILTRIGRGESVRHFDTVRLHKEGRPIDVSVTVSPIRDAAGTIIGASKVVRDITDRKLAEENIRRLNAELEARVIERTAQLETANRELEAFSYTVSHDLRTPLRAIDGFSQAVLEDFGPHLPEEGRQNLGVIRRAARQMGELIDDLLAFAQLNQQEVSKRVIDTGQRVRGILDELGSPWPDRHVELRLGELPACSGDPALLKQVWVNLLSNALKYTRKRDQAAIEIGCTKFHGADAFFVRDNGTGFDMGHADKLFGVFQRFHRAEDYEGTGVGLAIVQRIVNRHGGRVWAEAAVDRGATFYFTLEKETKP